MHDPLEQFLIKKIIEINIFGIDLSFTNSSLFMVLTILSCILFQYCAIRKVNIIPNKLQILLEISYNFIADMVIDNIGDKGKKYIPAIFSIFIFILFANLLGMLPFSFTITSHLAVTLVIATTLFVLITTLGFVKHGKKYLNIFFPQGAPLILAPILVPLELMSYLARPITLALRLFLNMTAGHIMLKVFAGFSIMAGSLFAIAPALLNVIFISFEFFVACLQAYIFTILVCIYLNDALNLH